jgi:hypothetical protein
MLPCHPFLFLRAKIDQRIEGRRRAVIFSFDWFCGILRHVCDNLRHRLGGFPFSPLNAAAVKTKELCLAFSAPWGVQQNCHSV